MRLNQHFTTTEDHRRARELRNDASPSERRLWVALRKEAAKKNLRFRRQAVIHPFIADFACMKAKLLIELDGYSHDVRQGYDQVRDEKLKKMGYSLLRFDNEDVDTNIEGVVAVILDLAEKLIQNAPTPCLPQGEGESFDYRGF
ncbi:MAG: DUF559 domain-containing protein [Alphaproteobacteria bacterium]|nr:DUF559 domain-containing protein [Alphaproteobacteria bacterium]